MSDELETRAATAADLPAVIELLHVSMGRADDDRFASLFRWKHVENAFGPSPMWVACAEGRVVGLRTFMRWEFERGNDVVRCVRAVDTATHPEFQGRGIFSRLTLAALPVMAADGVQFVFNTPNTQSLPGYLKMGWREVGRAPACIRPLSLPGAVRLARSRTPASHWSEPAPFGEPVDEVLAAPELDRLLSGCARSGRLRTRLDGAFVRWRYGTPLLGYRAIVGPGGIEAGVAFVRVRRRGSAVEVAVAAVITPPGNAGGERTLVREVVRRARGHADYLLGVGSLPGCVRVPSFGPVVTTRELAAPAPGDVAAFDFGLGDIELF